jgi:predicted flap endonuclease-1-like 5' DNA nuclease
MLNGMGIIRFDQLARLSDAEVERIDVTLGAFRGRLTRDKVVVQADYLARGDIDGFEQRFGKL